MTSEGGPVQQSWESPETEEVDQDPGQTQRENQNDQSEDPLAA